MIVVVTVAVVSDLDVKFMMPSKFLVLGYGNDRGEFFSDDVGIFGLTLR